jgi:hypothetical protein
MGLEYNKPINKVKLPSRSVKKLKKSYFGQKKMVDKTLEEDEALETTYYVSNPRVSLNKLSSTALHWHEGSLMRKPTHYYDQPTPNVIKTSFQQYLNTFGMSPK